MRITKFSVRNYQFTLIIFLALLTMGVFSLFNMPRSEDPVFNAPQFFIITVYPGTSPRDMEDLVVDPLEKRINELDDVKKIVSTIDDGIAIVGVFYKYESDPDTKYQEIVREVNALRKDLPQDLYSMDILKSSSSDVNIYQYALISENASYKQLKEEAEKLTDALEKNKSLKNVDSWGYPDQRINVELNIEKIAQYKIPLNRILGAIQSENVNIPAGSININTRKFNVKTSGKYSDIEQVKNTIVSSSGTTIVYLKDVANVTQDYEEIKYMTRANGHRAVLVTAAQKEGQNIVTVNESVVPVVEQFQKQLPKNIVMMKMFDQHEGVSTRLNHFARDFAIAIFLVLLTLLPLGTRASVVVMISIPLSLAIGVTLLNLFGYNINQLSIVGFIVALGLLVDDSIVVVENIERFMRNGYSRRKASIEATGQIGLAVIGCTVTLIFAFLPLVFLPEGSGDFIRSLPMAVILTIVASLFVSLTIVPFLASIILSKMHTNEEGNFFMRGLKKIIHASYAVFLDRALKRPVITLVIALFIFGGSLALIPVIGFSLFPRSEKPMFMINIETPDGTNIYETDRIIKDVEAGLVKYPEIRNFTTNVGRGNPRVYYNIIPRNESENYGQILVQLQAGTETPDKGKFIDKLREQFKSYPNAKIEVKDFEQGPPVEAPIAIRVFGENLDSLRAIAGDVEAMMKSTPGAIYVNNPLAMQTTSFRVHINKDKAGMLGIPIAEANKAIRLAIAGLNIGTFQDEQNNEQDIHVTLPKANKVQSFDVFKRLYVNSVSGASIPLNQIADVKFETSAPSIKHYDKNRYVVVTCFVKSGFLTPNVNNEIVQKLEQYKFSEGYTYTVAGEVESAQESFGGLGTIILITVFGFIGVLVLEFKSFKSTLIVLSVIPLGIIGAIFALLVVGYPFSFVAVIGLIALVGIEVKNTILLVDFTNQLREQGKNLEDAIREAGEIRFVPIVLTSLTAIGGLLPLALEGNPLYSPLAWVLIGGLISSTLLARLVTPVLYKLLPPKIEVKASSETIE